MNTNDSLDTTMNPFDHYGEWNTLVAATRQGAELGYVTAHDGDFFPEAVFDYIDAMRFSLSKDSTEPHIRIYPVRVDIDITQDCNAQCRFCFSRSYRSTKAFKHAAIGYDDIERIIAGFAGMGTKTIRLCGGGEPLLHKDIDKILPLPQKYGMRLCLITNGDMIDDDLSDNILSNVDHLRWSVNAATDRTRLRIHRPQSRSRTRRLTDTFAQIAALLARRRSLRGVKRRPMIWATYLLLPENLDEVVEAAHLLKDIGVDSISYRPVFHGLGRAWADADRARLRCALREAKDLHEPPKFFVHVPKRDLAEAASLRPYEHFDLCLSQHYRPVVEAAAAAILVRRCGLFRGKDGMADGELIPNHCWTQVDREKFGVNCDWSAASRQNCIDVSINSTLNFIWNILQNNRDARFFLKSM